MNGTLVYNNPLSPCKFNPPSTLHGMQLNSEKKSRPLSNCVGLQSKLLFQVLELDLEMQNFHITIYNSKIYSLSLNHGQ